MHPQTVVKLKLSITFFLALMFCFSKLYEVIFFFYYIQRFFSVIQDLYTFCDI